VKRVFRLNRQLTPEMIPGRTQIHLSPPRLAKEVGAQFLGRLARGFPPPARDKHQFRYDREEARLPDDVLRPRDDAPLPLLEVRDPLLREPPLRVAPLLLREDPLRVAPLLLREDALRDARELLDEALRLRLLELEVERDLPPERLVAVERLALVVRRVPRRVVLAR
jgi:hypothetical protein